MAGAAFPTTLADLIFHDDDDDHATAPTLYRTLRSLRQATLSIPNRLRSILQDAQFVQDVVAQHSPAPSGGGAGRPPLLPVIANERCGSWYIAPERKAGSAYFKSTDGHVGQWDFSLRRLNLRVLGFVGRGGGAVIVDSTRRGKGMPDAFARTVPIWVAVLNRFLFPEVGASHGLQRPPALSGPGSGGPCGVLVGESEAEQIEGRLEGFVRAFRGLELDVERLRNEVGRPMELFWRVNGSTVSKGGLGYESRSESGPGSYYPVILCSASRRVLGPEMSEGTYIQGAGDDSEGWSRGLTPALFWQHKDLLLSTPESELESLIGTLLVNDRENDTATGAVRMAPTWNLYLVKAAVGRSRIMGPAEQNVRTSSGQARGQEVSEQETEMKFDIIINCSKTDTSTRAGTQLDLGCRMGKLGSRNLREKLDLVRDFVQLRLKRNPSASILVTCETGKDLCVGVALMLLCLFYDNQGRVVVSPGPQTCSKTAANGIHVYSPSPEILDKSFIRRRLAWIVSSHPDANPSRATLQSVNGFLMERPD